MIVVSLKINLVSLLFGHFYSFNIFKSSNNIIMVSTICNSGVTFGVEGLIEA